MALTTKRFKICEKYTASRTVPEDLGDILIE
jgi:hypothetical protein